jgi:alkanesulfonate monooxygenase SsuD/methylene tetrahydromethanopterin reductase-like flavin-dependent oxidoreductase (luciferase family)
MRFGFMSEGETAEGKTYAHRYKELADEVIFAEQVGFDFFACSEQHFTFGATISAPESLFPYLFAKTEKIRFRHAVSLLPYQINHPLRVAERIATEDILSGGRIELGTGRANTSLIVKAFGVDPSESRDQWVEGVELIRAAFGEQPFTYKGKFFDIPKRYMIPQPIQRPYPPISVAATSPESQELAAKMGIGVMTSSYFFGWPWLEKLSEVYHRAMSSSEFPKEEANYHFTPLLYSYCGETDAEATRDGFDGIYNAARLASIAFSRLAEMSASYGYMAQADEIADKLSDPSWLIEESGTVVCGSPESCIAQIQRYIDLGASEIIIRVDGNGHERNLRALELFGKEVIPAFRSPNDRVPSGMVTGGIT